MNHKFIKEDLYPYAEKILKTRCPESEGWIVQKQNKKQYEQHLPDYIIDCPKERNILRVPVYLKCKMAACTEVVDYINNYCQGVPLNVLIVSKIVIYPSGADTQAIPKDILTLFIKEINIKKIAKEKEN
ncbi:hypothetical protein OX284_012320 [Flavobacterium sp. SUN046]|uniref:hypothetical protein n=1 Tax=Flavobacterium sp. SUN046 TaxID=3002440 RepID=UPI002DBB993D|nr:hypothetical protein [Flavobacterium sp. SUN046]MEC4050219.1 hypothetical protein [Flavobacterium sp. SUN046]